MCWFGPDFFFWVENGPRQLSPRLLLLTKRTADTLLKRLALQQQQKAEGQT
jgi:hypothetical protein